MSDHPAEDALSEMTMRLSIAEARKLARAGEQGGAVELGDGSVLVEETNHSADGPLPDGTSLNARPNDPGTRALRNPEPTGVSLRPRVQPRPPTPDQPFVDVTAEVGLKGKAGFRIYAADLNGDNYPDLVTVDNAKLKLFLNQQRSGSTNPKDRTFVDATDASGINARPHPQTNLVGLADLDNDGDIDLVTGAYYHRAETKNYDPNARNDVLLNDGKGVFRLKEGNGLAEMGLLNTSGFSFLDFNRDGHVDLFIGTWFKDYDKEQVGKNYLLQGVGDGTFEDVSEASNIASVKEPIYGTTATDMNNDGWPDILTSPYCRTPGAQWQNDGDGTFTNVARKTGYGRADRCQWGAQPADYDNDGDTDLLALIMHGSSAPAGFKTFMMTNAGASGGFRLDWQFGRLRWEGPQSDHRRDHYGMWLDLDNDGMLDFALTQAASEPETDKLFLMRQMPDNTFEDMTDDYGLAGAKRIDSPHALTTLDYDMDGDDDIVVGMYRDGQQLKLLRNDLANQNGHVSVRLDTSGLEAAGNVGARIKVYSGGRVLSKEILAGHGNFSNQTPYIVNFGIGEATVDRIEVEWPNPAVPKSVITNPDTDKLITIRPKLRVR